MTKLSFFQECKAGLTLENQSANSSHKQINEENDRLILVGLKVSGEKINKLQDKNSQESKNRKKIHNLIKKSLKI